MDQELKVEATTGEVRAENTLIPDHNYLNPLRGYLNAGTDSKSARELDYIYNQVKGDKDLNEGDILAAVREIRLRLGAPRLGENMVSKIFNYLRAAETVKTAEKIRDAHLA